LDYPIAFDKIDGARFKKVEMVNKELIEKLKTTSSERRTKSDDFTKLNKNIERYVEQKAKKRIPLNAEKFFKQRAELDAEKEEEKQFEDAANNNKEVVKRDFYFNEVMNITLDYAKAVNDNKLAVK
jgi:carboxyl-terminal processing protease